MIIFIFSFNSVATPGDNEHIEHIVARHTDLFGRRSAWSSAGVFRHSA